MLVSCGDEETQTSRWRQLVQELKGSHWELNQDDGGSRGVLRG